MLQFLHAVLLYATLCMEGYCPDCYHKWQFDASCSHRLLYDLYVTLGSQVALATDHECMKRGAGRYGVW